MTGAVDLMSDTPSGLTSDKLPPGGKATLLLSNAHTGTVQMQRQSGMFEQPTESEGVCVKAFT